MKTKLITRFFTIIGIAVLVQSCATYSGRIVKKDKIKLTDESFDLIAGTYELLPDKEYLKNGDSKHVGNKNSYYNLYRYIRDNKIEFDSVSKYYVDIKVITKRKLQFDLRKENLKIGSIQLDGKLKHNGLFYLDNKNFSCHGVPYIFGGCDNDKTRIGVAEDSGLLINMAINSSWAFLIMISHGHSYNIAYHYKRVK